MSSLASPATARGNDKSIDARSDFQAMAAVNAERPALAVRSARAESGASLRLPNMRNCACRGVGNPVAEALRSMLRRLNPLLAIEARPVRRVTALSSGPAIVPDSDAEPSSVRTSRARSRSSSVAL
jgi:hypothetical protein